MKLREIQLITKTVYIIIMMGLFYPLFSPVVSDKDHGFLSMSVLGEAGSTSNYFMNETSVTSINTLNNWTIRVSNQREKLTYITVKVKITGSNLEQPDIATYTPSTATTIYQASRVLKGSERIALPFKWGLTAISEQGLIDSMTINGETIQVNEGLDADMSGKLIFELWVYDPATEDISFKINQGDDYTCVWNQINFKAVS